MFKFMLSVLFAAPAPVQEAIVVTDKPVHQVSLSPDGSRVAFVSGGNVILWDTKEKKEVWRMRSNAQTGAITFSPDGKYVAVGQQASIIVVFESMNGKFFTGFRINDADPGPVQTAIWASNTHLLAGDTNGHLGVFRVVPRNPGVVFRGAVATEPIIPVTGTIVNEKPVRLLVRIGDKVRPVVFQDGKPVLSRVMDEGVVAVEPNTTTIVASKQGATEFRDKFKTVLVSLKDGVQDGLVAFGKDAEVIATCDKNGILRVHTRKGRPEFTRAYGEKGKAVKGLALSPDGKTLVVAGEEGVKLFLLKK